MNSNRNYNLVSRMLLTVFFLVSMLLLLSSCQTTPTRAIIQNKGNGELEKKIENSMNTNTNTNNIEDVPLKLQDNFTSTSGNISVFIDSKINYPANSNIPVYIIKPADISQNQANQMVKTLIGDKTLYIPQGNAAVTKDQIILEIGKLQDVLDKLDKNDINFNTNKTELEKSIAQYKNFLKTAPDKKEMQTALLTFSSLAGQRDLASLDAEWQKNKTVFGEKASEKQYNETRQKYLDSINNADQVSIEGEAYLNHTKPAYIKIFKTKDNKNNSLFFENSDLNLNNSNFGSLNIDENKAIAEAKNCINSMGIKYMNLVAVTQPKNSMEYSLFFTRTFDGIDITYVNTESGLQQYRAPWPLEYLNICINDDGIAGVYWISPTEVVTKMSANVGILPFDDIKRLFSKNMLIQKSWSEDKDIISRRIYINNISFGMIYLPKNNSQDEYLTIPVWDFFGYEIDKYSDSYASIKTDHYVLDSNNERKVERFRYSYLTINAIDGSVIDRNNPN